MNYKKLIIELLDKIDNGKFLRRIYISLREHARENGTSGELESEKDRLISDINGILHATNDLWILKQIYRCASNITKEDSKQ